MTSELGMGTGENWAQTGHAYGRELGTNGNWARTGHEHEHKRDWTQAWTSWARHGWSPDWARAGWAWTNCVRMSRVPTSIL